LHAAVTPEDMAAIARALIDKAKTGDVAAARELLDRIIGRSTLAQAPDGGSGGETVVVQLEFDDAG
jgi:cobalamin biosynthesis protein CobD/CbiB